VEERGQVNVGAATIDYRIIRSPRRTKTIEISIGHGEGVLVAAPVATSLEAIRDIVHRRARWILQRSEHQTVRPTERAFESGESLPYLGRHVPIRTSESHGDRVGIRFEQWGFQVAVPRGIKGAERLQSIRASFSAWYRRRAAERINATVRQWTGHVGAAPARVVIRDQRRRWGSCSPDGVLRLNWRIVMADPALIDYVVVHELAHLLHPNHSKDFWAEVARVMPDFSTRRAQLKEVGPSLNF
jgi:hypothetical protein